MLLQINMNSKNNDILDLLIKVTEIDNASDLISEFQSIIQSEFSNSRLTIYEIYKSRDNNKNTENIYYGINSLNREKKPIILNNRNEFIKCIKTKKIVKRICSDNNRKTIIHPIFEGGQITYIVSFEAGSTNREDEEFLRKIVKIFNNQLFLINSKNKDFLTGLFNRDAYNRTINIIFSSPSDLNFSSEQRTLILIDIDHFKTINDNYGHLMGDEILVLFSRLLKSSFRQNDLIFRYGGEEFLLILNNDIEQTRQIMERFRSKVESYKFPRVKRVTISAGYVSINPADNPLILVDKADRALYYAKTKGRNRIFSYESLIEDSLIKPVTENYGAIEIWD